MALLSVTLLYTVLFVLIRLTPQMSFVLMLLVVDDRAASDSRPEEGVQYADRRVVKFGRPRRRRALPWPMPPSNPKALLCADSGVQLAAVQVAEAE